MTNGYIQVPPDSSGKRVLTATHTIGSKDYQAQVVHIADPVNPEQSQRIDRHGAAVVSFTEGQPILSGFGSLKVTDECPLSVYQLTSQQVVDLTGSTTFVGSGTMRMPPVEASAILSVGGEQGARSQYMTNRYHYYCPGTSNVYKMTLSVGDAGKVGNIRRWGAFDAKDGLFFELNGTELNVVIRSSTSGTVTERRVTRSEWNHDKLDGNGLSGAVLDGTKVHIWWFDYQWLGAGRVRFGIYSSSGSRVVCHQFENAGFHTLPYMRTGTLPVCVENLNESATGSTSEMRLVCVGVYAEGDSTKWTYWHWSDINKSNKLISTNTPLVSLRPKALIDGNHNHAAIYPAVLNTYSDQPFSLTLMYSAIPSNGTWVEGASRLDYNTDCSNVDVSNAIPFKTLYLPAGANSLNLMDYYDANSDTLRMRSDGNYSYWTAVCSPLSGASATITYNLSYKELW